MMRPRALSAALFLALATAAPAQEYTLKLKQAPTGAAVAVQQHDQFKLEFKLTDGGGNAIQSKKEARELKFAYRETGLVKPDDAAQFTSLKREYQKAERSVAGVKEALPYQGKTVVLDRKEGKYSFRIDGGDELDGKEAEELNDEFNKGNLKSLNRDTFLPKNPVKVGDPWKLEVTPIGRELARSSNFALDEAKSTGTGKLLRVYRKGGRQFGVIETVMDFTITHLVDPKSGVRTPCQDSSVRLKSVTDTCIDGAREQSVTRSSWTSDVRAEFNDGGQKLTLTVAVRGTLEESRAEAE